MAWHSSSMLNGDLRLYHDLVARYPSEEISRWAGHLGDIASALEEILGHDITGKGSLRMIKIGSVPERTCVKKPVEYDLNFVISYSENDVVIQKSPEHPAYCTISEKGKSEEQICPENLSEGYVERLRRRKREIPHFSTSSSIYKRGVSSVMLDFKDGKELLFQVDVVPGVEVRRQKGPPDYYIPRRLPRPSTHLGWLVSTAVKETQMLSQLEENDPRLMCLRIVKAIRDGNPELKRLWSVVIKNVLLKHKEQADWCTENLGVRVIKCIQALSSAFCNKVMKKHFSPSINLLGTYKDEEMNVIYKRLCELVRDEEIFSSFINGQVVRVIEERGRSSNGSG